jgi:phage terminase Nu1 subunit (DNA packaging protein)
VFVVVKTTDNNPPLVDVLASAYLTERDFAELLNSTQQMIDRMIHKGVLTRRANALTWLRELHRYHAEGHAGRTGTRGLDLAQERARLAISQTARNNFKLKQARNEYIPVPLLIDVLNRSFLAARNHLLRIPNAIKSQFSHLIPGQIFVAIDNEVRVALTNLANDRLPLDIQRKIDQWKKHGTITPDESSDAAETSATNERKAVSKVSQRKRRKASAKTRGTGKADRRATARNLERDVEGVRAHELANE